MTHRTFNYTVLIQLYRPRTEYELVSVTGHIFNISVKSLIKSTKNSPAVFHFYLVPSVRDFLLKSFKTRGVKTEREIRPESLRQKKT